MSIDRMSRRLFLTRGAGAALATPLFWTAAMRAAMPQPAAATPVEKDLDGYITGYMAAMNAPGMTLGLTDSSKTLRTAGYGFADVDNAMQGYRPTAVTEYAVRLLRAECEAKTLPAAPAIANPLVVDNAADCAGVFRDGDGRKLEFAVEGKQLFWADEEKRIPLQHTEGDNFISTIEGVFANHTFIFGRARAENPKSGT
jgi:hypothetical protein